MLKDPLAPIEYEDRLLLLKYLIRSYITSPVAESSSFMIFISANFVLLMWWSIFAVVFAFLNNAVASPSLSIDAQSTAIARS